MSTLPQQPSAITEIFSNSFKLYVKSFPKWIGYSLIALFISMLMIFTYDSTPVDNSGNEIWLFELIAFSVLLLIYTSTIYRIDNVVNEREDDFVQPLLLAVKKLPSMFAGTLLFCVILMLVAMLSGVVIFVLMASTIDSMDDLWPVSLAIIIGIPGIIIISIPCLLFGTSPWLLFGYYILFDDLLSYQSLIASYRFVRGHWWRTFWVFFLPIGHIVFISLFPLLGAFFIPYFFILGYLQYHDLKLRKNMA